KQQRQPSFRQGEEGDALGRRCRAARKKKGGRGESSSSIGGGEEGQRKSAEELGGSRRGFLVAYFKGKMTYGEIRDEDGSIRRIQCRFRDVPTSLEPRRNLGLESSGSRQRRGVRRSWRLKKSDLIANSESSMPKLQSP
ncbi:hypothetical protein LINGRAHAP2_LOCUS10590, partial [Linum grandiflorum]